MVVADLALIDTSVKIALVGGASRGIGEAIALRLVREGFFVVGTATSNEGAQRIEKKVRERFGGRLRYSISRVDGESFFNVERKKHLSCCSGEQRRDNER